ncbi:hypothetical protein [Pseudomonas aeruginosa]
MKQKPGIALPRWLLRTTTMQMHSVDVVLFGIQGINGAYFGVLTPLPET